MNDRTRHVYERQTNQAMATLGRTVREMLTRGVEPTELLAKVERACREARFELDGRAA